MHAIGTVAALWRYPVKSMRGEQRQELLLQPEGIAGDRRFAFTSTAAPAGKPLLSSRERTAMLRYTPRLDLGPEVLSPSGRAYSLFSPELIAEIALSSASPGGLSLQQSPADPLTDVRPISLVSCATLDQVARELGRPLDPQHFRSNLILALDGNQPFAEDGLSGGVLRFGHSQGPALRVLERIPRCRFASLDPDTTAADPDLLRHLARAHNGRLGIYATVAQPGSIQQGDPVFLDALTGSAPASSR